MASLNIRMALALIPLLTTTRCQFLPRLPRNLLGFTLGVKVANKAIQTKKDAIFVAYENKHDQHYKCCGQDDLKDQSHWSSLRLNRL